MSRKTTVQEPVCVEEFGSEVSLSDFDSWVTSLCIRYQDDGRWQKYFWEMRGLSNDIQKELIPLACLCKRIAPQRPKARLRYVHGSSQSFDAEIIEDGVDSEILEVTLACNGRQEALAAEALLEYGYAPLYSAIEHSGLRASREIPEPELQCLDTDEIVKECIDLVRKAVDKKSSSGKYKDIHLVVAFDDFRLVSSEHHRMAEYEFARITSRFKSIYFVGLCGSFFLHSGTME